MNEIIAFDGRIFMSDEIPLEFLRKFYCFWNMVENHTIVYTNRVEIHTVVYTNRVESHTVVYTKMLKTHTLQVGTSPSPTKSEYPPHPWQNYS